VNQLADTAVGRAAQLRTVLRRDLKTRLAGLLPVQAKVHVRTEQASLMTEIAIRVQAPDWWALDPDPKRGLSDAARIAGNLLTDLLAEFTGPSWGEVTINDRCAGSVARSGWRPNDD
jgi:hypothetical protein